MIERIIEIIVFVISELRNHKDIADINLSKLRDLGYTNSEISTAFSWLVDRVEFSEDLFSGSEITNKNSFRMLHEAEKELFTDKALGEIIQLQSLGIIKSAHIELIIERAIMTEHDKIDSNALKSFVAHTIFSQNINPVGASRIMLNGSDSIN